jgi:RNA polymerase sigma-70 factor, ECF subfamily
MNEKRPAPADDIFPVIYAELKKVARRYLGRERRNHTLQPTALVNEAWLKLENQHGGEWQGRTHGLAIAAQAMRRLLVDHGRHQKRQKRGGGAAPIALDELVKAATTGAVPVEDLLRISSRSSRP